VYKPPVSIIQPQTVAIGSAQLPGVWSPWLSADAALPAITSYHGNINAWANSVGDGLLWLPSGGRACGSLSFLQGMNAGGDPNGLTSSIRVWITSTDLIDGSALVEGSAVYAFDATLTSGAADVPTGSMHTTPLVRDQPVPNGFGVSFTKSIAVSPDCTLSPGVRHIGQTGGVTNAWDRIAFDLAGGSGILIATAVGDVDQLRVRWQPF
jgi:hypothetical protein